MLNKKKMAGRVPLENVSEEIVVYSTSSSVIWAFFGMSGPV
jgi:hypothetical protein